MTAVAASFLSAVPVLALGLLVLGFAVYCAFGRSTASPA